MVMFRYSSSWAMPSAKVVASSTLPSICCAILKVAIRHLRCPTEEQEQSTMLSRNACKAMHSCRLAYHEVKNDQDGETAGWRGQFMIGSTDKFTELQECFEKQAGLARRPWMKQAAKLVDFSTSSRLLLWMPHGPVGYDLWKSASQPRTDSSCMRFPSHRC